MQFGLVARRNAHTSDSFLIRRLRGIPRTHVFVTYSVDHTRLRNYSGSQTLSMDRKRLPESRQTMWKEIKIKIGVTGGSGEWTYLRSEHRNVRAGLIITRFTFFCGHWHEQ